LFFISCFAGSRIDAEVSSRGSHNQVMFLLPLIAIAAQAAEPLKMDYFLEYDGSSNYYRLQIRSLNYKPVQVLRHSDFVWIVFEDKSGTEIEAEQIAFSSYPKPGRRDWQVLNYWDEASIGTISDHYRPDPRIATITVRFSSGALKYGLPERIEGIPAFMGGHEVVFPVKGLNPAPAERVRIKGTVRASPKSGPGMGPTPQAGGAARLIER
jgi:hypothetical protein